MCCERYSAEGLFPRTNNSQGVALWALSTINHSCADLQLRYSHGHGQVFPNTPSNAHLMFLPGWANISKETNFLKSAALPESEIYFTPDNRLTSESVREMCSVAWLPWFSLTLLYQCIQVHAFISHRNKNWHHVVETHQLGLWLHITASVVHDA